MLDPSKVNLVVYHANCSDGFGAAWAAWTFLGNRAEYFPAKHGSDPPDVKGKVVLFVDFVYDDVNLMHHLLEEADDFWIIDHHKTTLTNLSDISQITFDMGKSAAILTWEYFYPTKEPPRFLQYIMDRDLWKWELPYSREFSAFFDMVPFEFEEYDKFLVDSAIDDACKRGSYILAYAQTMIDKVCKNAVRRRLAGWECLVVNSAHWASEIGERLSKKADIAMVWFYDHEQGYYNCGLRSAHDDVDVSAIANSFGGGGHRRAAGFQARVSNIEEIFDDEKLIDKTV